MPGIAIALSGGAARCIAHLGVIEVLIREGIPVEAVSGTSGGALVGALFASGRFSPEDLVRLAEEVSWRRFARPVLSVRGLLSSLKVRRFVEDLIGEMTFSQTILPFAAVASDLMTGARVVLREGSVGSAVQASCSLPVIFKPTEYGNRWLVDGGIVSQIPVRAAREELGGRFVIAVDVNFGGMDGVPTPRNSIQIAIHMASLVARRNAEEEGRTADFMIPVNIKGIGLTDLHLRKELLNRGRLAAEGALGHLKARISEFSGGSG